MTHTIPNRLEADAADRPWRLVILESPFKADTPDLAERNTAYARAAMRDCLLRGEAPFASHMLYPQPGVLDDHSADERTMGIDAGLAWGKVADATVCYLDLGRSGGMQLGIDRARQAGRPVEYRKLSNWRWPA